MSLAFYRLVTAEEVVNFVAPMNNTIGILEDVVIASVEDMVEDYCERRFELQTYTNEQYLIRRPTVTFDGITVVPRLELRLKNRPINYFHSLKQVNERDVSNIPIDPVTIDRSFYTLDFNSGILIFGFQATGPDPYIWPFSTVPGVSTGPYIELVASYDAGYSPIPPRLKQAVLMIIYRIYIMTLKQNWHRTESQTAGAIQIWEHFIREEGGLTPEEKLILNRFKAPVAA